MMVSLIALSSTATFAADATSQQCVPSDSVLCTIDKVYAGYSLYYELRTTLQSVSSIYVGDMESDSTVDSTVAQPALAKLVSQANQLKAVGVCNLVINNIQ